MIEDVVGRRLLMARLLAGTALGGAMLASATEEAEAANILFENTLFLAGAGATTKRTPSARASDIKNVLDYGADPTGVNDSRAAIQAAIDYTTAPFSAAARGIIFFPPGTYKIVASGGVGLTFNQAGDSSIVFEGCGDCSVISGSFAGPLLQRDLGVLQSPYGGTKAISKLKFVNSDPAGTCVRWGSSIGLSVRDCLFSGYRCLMLSDTGPGFGADQSWSVDTCNFNSGGIVGAMALSAGGNGSIRDCDITGFAVGINIYGLGIGIYDCRYETNTVGIRTGLYEDGTSGAGMSGFEILGGSFESNGTAILFATGSGFGTIGGFKTQAFPGATIYDGTVVASTNDITGAISGAVGTGSIASDGTMTITAMTSGTFQVNEFISGTNVPSGTFIKVIPAGGHTGTYNVRGSPAYCIRINSDALQYSTLSGISAGGAFTIASIHCGVGGLANANRQGLVFNGVAASNGLSSSLFPSATDWVLPTTAHTAEWINCNVQPTFLFAGLPTGANRRTGDRYFITDANTATLGNPVTAGGAPNTAGLVIWNGSAWTLMSK